jgi:hypothetical protein
MNYKLFQRYKILLYGGFPLPGPPQSGVSTLLQMGGAYICSSIDELYNNNNNNKNSTYLYRYAICADINSKNELKLKMEDYINNKSNTTSNNNNNNNNNNIIIVNPYWCLDSVTNFNIVSNMNLCNYQL